MKNDRIRLLHIKESLERSVSYCQTGKEFFLKDIKTQDAVIRNLEVIGEAVKHLSLKLKRAHKDVSWKRVAGMRDKLIHDYFGVNVALVWETVQKEVPLLLKKIEEILGSSSKI